MAFLALLFVIAFGTLVLEAIMSDQPSITCPDCGMTSYNPNDIVEGYCSNCHDWTSRRMPDTKRTPRGAKESDD